MDINNLLPKFPHNAIICGKTRSGKTYQMLNIIEEYYKNIFDYVIISAQHIMTIKHTTEYG